MQSGAIPSARRRRLGPRPTPAGLLVLAGLVSILSIPLVANAGRAWALPLDTTQQVLVASLSFVAVRIGTRGAHGDQLLIARGLGLTLVLTAIGVVLWLMRPFSDISDGAGDFLILVGVGEIGVVLGIAIFVGMPAARILRVALDTAVLMIASATLLWLSWRQSLNLAALGPGDVSNIVVGMITVAGPMAACLALLDRGVRIRLRGPYAVLAGLALGGLSMIGWQIGGGGILAVGVNVRSTDYAYSLGAILAAWGAITWDLDPRSAAGSRRIMQAAADLFPLSAVGACVALLLAAPADAADLTLVKLATGTAVMLGLARQMVLTVAERRARVAERESSSRLQDEMRTREAVLRSLSRLDVADSPEATAGAVCREALGIDGIDSAAVIAFTTGGRASLLGGSHLDGIPLGEPTWFPEPRAKQLLQMAALGPWIENARPTTAGTSRSIFAADTKAVINAPLIWHERLVGVISFGTLTEPATGLMEERLATTREFGVVAGALLGPAIEERGRLQLLRESLTDIIETRSFRPVFQPIVELSTGTIVGYEALTRFHDGKRPDRRFVDAAAAGLGIQLEVACLRAAQREAVRLPMGRYLSINVSPEMATALIPLLATLEGIEREIVIEITEQAHVVSYARLRDALEKVRGHARIAVDDAGAGYAGLQHILEIRPHIVKLDIALVRGVNADPARRALIGSMAAFAAETEATLLAEGIETEEELATLRGLGVELGQGYLLGRPAGVDDLEESHRAVA